MLLSSIAACIIFLIPWKKSIESFSLKKLIIELEAGGEEQLGYMVVPEDITNLDIVWTSTDEEVATVDKDGVVHAISDGSCFINAVCDGKEASCEVIVQSGPDFSEIFETYCGDNLWAEIAVDDSYFSIDTNPFDIEDYTNYDALDSIEQVNRALGFGDSLYQKMLQTRSLDGRPTQSNEYVTVSWTYHPDHGLQVMYEKKDV